MDRHSSAGSSMEVCFICGGMPCEWDEYGAEMLVNLEATYPKDDQGQHIDPSTGLPVPLNTVRFALYQSFIYLKYGHLGRLIEFPFLSASKTRSRRLTLTQTEALLDFKLLLEENNDLVGSPYNSN